MPWPRGASGAGRGRLVLLAQLRVGGDDAGEEGSGFFELEELDGLADLPSAGADERFQLAPNTLAFQIQPDEGLGLVLNGKVPGLETRTQPVKMSFRYATTFGSNTPEAYERLVLDAMIGDGTLFIRGDEAETSWSLYTPVLEAWAAAGRAGIGSYAAGSWGPACADALLAAHGHEWRKP